MDRHATPSRRRLGPRSVRRAMTLFAVTPLALFFADPAVMPAAASEPVPTDAPATPGTASVTWPPSARRPLLELVESHPIETGLDHPDIPEAYEVWLEMIRGASVTLDLAEFYASNAPESRLEPIVQAIEEAAARGVRVRFLAEKKFYATYPQTLDRLRARGVTVRMFDVAALMGGVLHAKYFLVDGGQAFIGSQNFDWRALTHIQELGLRIRLAPVVEALDKLFEIDWALAGGTEPSAVLRPAAPGVTAALPVDVPDGEDTLRVTLVGSPRDWLPQGLPWDLPRIVSLIDGARRTVRVQLLTYRTSDRGSGYFDELESALRRAAARGVSVQLLVADWSLRPGMVEGLQSLAVLPQIEVRVATIPPWSGGFVPYARVMHAKYLVVDGRAAWIGTGNWERDYFFASRNVGVILEGAGIPATLDEFFAGGWNGPYAQTIDPCATYRAPHIGD